MKKIVSLVLVILVSVAALACAEQADRETLVDNNNQQTVKREIVYIGFINDKPVFYNIAPANSVLVYGLYGIEKDKPSTDFEYNTNTDKIPTEYKVSYGMTCACTHFFTEGHTKFPENHLYKKDVYYYNRLLVEKDQENPVKKTFDFLGESFDLTYDLSLYCLATGVTTSFYKTSEEVAHEGEKFGVYAKKKMISEDDYFAFADEAAKLFIDTTEYEPPAYRRSGLANKLFYFTYKRTLFGLRTTESIEIVFNEEGKLLYVRANDLGAYSKYSNLEFDRGKLEKTFFEAVRTMCEVDGFFEITQIDLPDGLICFDMYGNIYVTLTFFPRVRFVGDESEFRRIYGISPPVGEYDEGQEYILLFQIN